MSPEVIEISTERFSTLTRLFAHLSPMEFGQRITFEIDRAILRELRLYL